MRLRIGFAYDNDQPGVVVDNPDELDAVLDQAQRRALELNQPIIAIRATAEPPVRGQASVEVGINRDRGYISVYARHRDYHDVLKGRLKELAGWIAARFGGAVKVFVDTAPLLEKPLAPEEVGRLAASLSAG